MIIDLTPITDELRPGAKLTKAALAKRMERSEGWVTHQGRTVRARGETWRASYYNGGRTQHYTLLARLEPMIAPVKSGSAGQRANAAS